MAYAGLTDQKIRECQKKGWTKEEIMKLNEMEIKTIGEKLRAFTIERYEGHNSHNDELRLVLLGKTGSGKSSVGNLILGDKLFATSNRPTSCTSTIDHIESDFEGVRLRVIDTPGLFDTGKSEKYIKTELAKVCDRFCDGIHGFLFVFNMGSPRFTDQESQVFEIITQGIFGPMLMQHCFVIITHGNMLEDQTLDQFMESNKDSDLGKLVFQVGKKKVIAVENSEKTVFGQTEQRQQIIRMISNEVKGVYTDDALREFQRQRAESAQKLHPDIQYLAPDIEDKLSQEIQPLWSHEMMNMADSEKKKIVMSVFKKLQPHTDPSFHGHLEGGITQVLDNKLKRVTNIALGAGLVLLVGLFASVSPIIYAAFLETATPTMAASILQKLAAVILTLSIVIVFFSECH